MGNDALDMQWKEAFARLSEPYWDALLRFAVSLCHSQERAEDLLQTSLVRGVRFFQKFCEKNFAVDDPRELDGVLCDAARARHFKNWLYKILKNVYLDDQAASGKWSFDADEESLENRPDESNAFHGPFDHEAPFTGQGPADPKTFATQQSAFFQLAADDKLKTDLEVLSDRQRSVLYLIAEDYSYKEVASILNIPIGTVMSTLSRGLGKLRARIAGRSEPPVAVKAEPRVRAGAVASSTPGTPLPSGVEGIRSQDSGVLTLDRRAPASVKEAVASRSGPQGEAKKVVDP